MSLGLPPDTPPEDILLVSPVVDEQGRMLGREPAADVRQEFERCRRWLAAEVDARAKGSTEAP